MITVNINNGILQFEGFLICPLDKIRDLKSKFSDEYLELWIENGNWTTYRLDAFSKFILLIRYFNDEIQLIEVYPKGSNDNQRKKNLILCLKKLGGEKKYSWGSIEMNNDFKAGYESLIINFNSNVSN
jgi:hypothetical protein